MKATAFFKISSTLLLILSLNACATLSDLGTTVVDTAGKAGDAVKGIFSSGEKK